MKELSIEEKAKRYNEAIERAKIWQEHLYDVNDKDYADELNYIFPELKEGEDEKTKRILYSISSKISFHLCDIFTEEEFQCFDAWSNAWLKKQEQKPADKVEPKFHEGDIIKPKDGGHEPWQIMQVDIFDKKYRFKDGYVVHFSQEDAYELVEQKPTDEEMKRLLQTEYEKGRADVLAEIQEFWSEEDEKQLNDIMWIIEAYRKNGFNETHIQIADNSENWLKSIKDRVQPKQEWSEEDKKIKDKIMHSLIYNVQLKVEDILDIDDWFNFLIKNKVQPQSQWKPSEEQIKALWNVYQGGEEQAELATLYNDLKKLREE